MPVCGLKLTLSEILPAQHRACEHLVADPRLTLGVRQGRFLAVVAETGSREEELRLPDDLLRLPGVEHVDIVFVEIADGRPSNLERLGVEQ